MSSKIRGILLAGIMIALLAGVVLVGQVDGALAGSNGQQVLVHMGCVRQPCGTGYKEIIVTGRNQYGNTVTWRKTYSNGGLFGLTYVYGDATWNWWWVGSVKITATRWYGGTKTCYANVPKVQSSNLYYVTCVP